MIDEKKLLEVLKEWSDCYRNKTDGFSMLKWTTITRLKALVEQQPKVDEWNPCSDGNNLPKEPETLPTEDDSIERMILDGEFEEYVVMIYGAKKATTLYYLGNGDWYDELSGECYRVVAWQPLPELLEGANNGSDK